MGGNAWSAVTWDFTTSATWGSVALPTAVNNTVSYDAAGAAATTGNFVTFYSTTGSIVHPSSLTNGIGFSAKPDGTDSDNIYSSTSAPANNYAKIVVPAGSTVSVTAYTSSNRLLKVLFKGAETSFNANWVESTKDFVNDTEGSLDLYMYSAQNPGGTGKAAYLRKVELKQTCAVTINYRDKDDLENTLISSKVVNVEEGASYTPTYDTNIYVSDSDPYEYTYYSGATERKITEDTSVDILYSKGDRATYSYTVKTSTGSTIQSGSAYKNASVTYYWAQVLNIDGVLYSASAVGDQYKTSFTLDSDKKEVTVTYTASPTITNLVFLAEGENLFTRGTGSSADIRLSLGAGGYASEKTSFVTLPAGTYYMVLTNRCSGNQTATHKFYKGDAKDPFFSADGNGYNSERTSGEFTLDATTTLYMQGGSNANLVDWIYIYGTPTAALATITSAGWATFSSRYDLDFSTPISGLTAYIATKATASTITLEEVTGKVKAGDGLVLKGAANTYSIPVTTDATTIYTNTGEITMWGNTGTGTETVSAAGSGTNFVLSIQSGNVVFAPIDDDDATLNPGQAALWANVDVSTARALNIVFGDEATAISAVQNSKEKSDEMYNLAGQRVAQPTKGLYIVNGKKVIMK